MHIWKSITFSTALALSVFGIATTPLQAQDRPMTLKPQGDFFVAKGYIDRRTPARVAKALNSNPGIRTIVFLNVPGSDDDDANLQASRMIRKAGVTTVIPSNGLVASGGTDMFLAGKRRLIEKGACVGVHSWAAGNREGADFPDNSAQHRPYLNYYKAMGIRSAFYWFTLDAASAGEMYWMSASELNSFKMATSRLKFGSVSEGQRNARCDRR